MILQYILLCISLYMYFDAPERMNKDFMILGVLIALTSVIKLIKTREKQTALKQQYMRHSYVFIVGFIIVFYQFYIDYIIGLVDEDLKFIWIDSRYVCKSLALSNVALISFIIGYMKRKTQEPLLSIITTQYVEKCSNKYGSVNLRCLYSFLLLLLCFYIICVNKEYLFGGYGQSEEGGIAAEVNKFFYILLLFTLAYNSYMLKNKKVTTLYHFVHKNRVLLLIISLRIFFILLSGARHECINLLFLLLISFLYVTEQKIKMRYIVFACLFFSLSFTIVGILRSSDDSLGTAVNSLPVSISPFTSELAGSIRTLHVAVTYVPEQIPYNKGVTVLGYFFLIFPGGRSLFFSLFGIPSYLMSSGSFFSTIILGEDASWQLGSSCVADIYICYGVIGVLCIFFLFGWLLRKIEYMTFVNRYSSLCIVSIGFLFYSHCFFINRESLFSSLFGISYLLIFSILFSKLFRI